MEEFIICFCQDYLKEGNTIPYLKGSLLRTDKKEMFKWIELAHTNNIKISIYSAIMICDIS